LHEADDALSERIVRNSDDGSVPDCGLGSQYSLDLDG
jgi:hypothetical protein